MKIHSRFLNSYHLVVALGVLVFAVADENMVYVALAIASIVAARVLASGPNPLFVPRWGLNLVVVLVTVGMGLSWTGNPEDAIPTISRYLVWLQLVKLFERPRPRDQAMTIIMSVMLVVGSSLTSVSAEFGLALLLYIPTLIVTLMLFQLYLGQVDDHGTVRHVVVSGRRPGADMRWLVLGAVVLTFGLSVPVFVAMPRGIGSDSTALGRFAGRPKGNATTGFRDHVQLGSSGLITESTRVVLEMRVTAEPDPHLASGKHYLRGAVLDIYNAEQGRWQAAGHGRNARDEMVQGGASGHRNMGPGEVLGELPRGTTTRLTQEISIHAETVPSLFTVWRPKTIALESERRARVWYDSYRGTFTPVISARSADYRRYTVVSTPYGQDSGREYNQRGWMLRSWSENSRGVSDHVRNRVSQAIDWIAVLRQKDIISLQEFNKFAPAWVHQSEAPDDPTRGANPFIEGPIQELAEQIIADRRIPLDESTRTHEAAARAFETYLQDNYLYTTTMVAPRAGQDPIEMFLFDQELGGRGHCEYFASAVAAMCMSVGIPARVITGYVASEIDAAGQYIVRENHAHAWAEVEVSPGRWVVLDPSPQQDIERLHSGGGSWLAGIRKVFDVFQLAWIRSVVTFDRDEALQSANQNRVMLLTAVNNWVGERLLNETDNGATADRDSIGAAARSFLSIVLVSTLLTSLAYVVVSYGTRAIKPLLGLGAGDDSLKELSPKTRTLMEIHDKMLHVLHKAGLIRQASVPALAFGGQLAERDGVLSEDAQRLTSLYYAARYGREDVDDADLDMARGLLDGIRERLSELESIEPSPPLA